MIYKDDFIQEKRIVKMWKSIEKCVCMCAHMCVCERERDRDRDRDRDRERENLRTTDVTITTPSPTISFFEDDPSGYSQSFLPRSTCTFPTTF